MFFIYTASIFPTFTFLVSPVNRHFPLSYLLVFWSTWICSRETRRQSLRLHRCQTYPCSWVLKRWWPFYVLRRRRSHRRQLDALGRLSPDREFCKTSWLCLYQKYRRPRAHSTTIPFERHRQQDPTKVDHIVFLIMAHLRAFLCASIFP